MRHRDIEDELETTLEVVIGFDEDNDPVYEERDVIIKFTYSLGNRCIPCFESIDEIEVKENELSSLNAELLNENYDFAFDKVQEYLENDQYSEVA